jgi:hypothetical protein
MTVLRDPAATGITGAALSSDERAELVAMLEIALEHAFPSALAAPANRLGDSPAQDFYFRKLLARMLDNARATGLPVVIGSIDDVWRFVDDLFDEAKRACGPQTRRCGRETVRQFLAFQWRQHFTKAPRVYTFDERVMDTDAREGATIEFEFVSAGELHPIMLSAAVRDYRRADGTRVDLLLPDMLPAACWLEPLEDRPVPLDEQRLVEQSHAVVRTLLRLVEPPPDVARELRALAKRKTADAEQTAAFQDVLRDVRRGVRPAEAIPRLQTILNDPDADLRDIQRTAEELKHADPAARRSVVERFRKMVEGVVAVLLVGFVLVYYVPSPLKGAVRERVRRVFDRIMGAKLFSTLMQSGVDTDRGVFIQPNGVEAPEIRTPSGSSVRLNPGPSQNLMNVQAHFGDKDIGEIRDYVVVLGDLATTGLAAMQYRAAPHEPPIPWIAEVVLMPLQDTDLAGELAAKKATVNFSYEPPLLDGGITRSATSNNLEEDHHVRLAFVSDMREFPHVAQTYTITATVQRASGRQERYTGELKFNEDGFATFTRERGAPIAHVLSTIRVVPPRCVTMMHKHIVMPGPWMGNIMMTQAMVEHEQDVIFSVGYPTPPPGERPPTGCTIDYGDGSPADYERSNGTMMMRRHSYRVGDRPYTVTVYFENSTVTYQFELYVFSNRKLPAAARTLTYATPYPPNFDDAPIASGATSDNPGPVEIMYLERDPTVYQLNAITPDKTQGH